MSTSAIDSQEELFFAESFLNSKKRGVCATWMSREAVTTCLSFATSNTARKQFCHYLLPNSYVNGSAEASIKSLKKDENF